MPHDVLRSLPLGPVRWVVVSLVAEASVVAWFGIWLAVQLGDTAPGDALGTWTVVAWFVGHAAGAIAMVVRSGRVGLAAWLTPHVVTGAVLCVGGLWLLRERWLGAAIAVVGLATAVTSARLVRAAATWPPDRIVPALIGGAVLALGFGAVLAPADPDPLVRVSCRAPVLTVFGAEQLVGSHLSASGHGEAPEVVRAFCLPDARRRLAFTFVVVPASTVAWSPSWRTPRGAGRSDDLDGTGGR